MGRKNNKKNNSPSYRAHSEKWKARQRQQKNEVAEIADMIRRQQMQDDYQNRKNRP